MGTFRNNCEMKTVYRTSSNKVLLLQTAYSLAVMPILVLLQAPYTIVGLTIALLSNSLVFIGPMIFTPSISTLLKGQALKYTTFMLTTYASLTLQPYAWPQALYGIVLGQIIYVLACLFGTRHAS